MFEWRLEFVQVLRLGLEPVAGRLLEPAEVDLPNLQPSSSRSVPLVLPALSDSLAQTLGFVLGCLPSEIARHLPERKRFAAASSLPLPV